MANQTDIMTRALYKLAQSSGIPTIADTSLAAQVMNKAWPDTLAFVQADAVWPFLLKSQALALSNDAPDPGWGFRYSRPNDCLTAWAVTDERGLRQYRNLWPWTDPSWRAGIFGSLYDWTEAYGTVETEIQTDIAQARLIYTVFSDEPGRFPIKFIEALSARLAYDCAGPIIGDLGLNNRAGLLQEYMFYKSDAAAHAYNQSRDTQEERTPALIARGG